MLAMFDAWAEYCVAFHKLLGLRSAESRDCRHLENGAIHIFGILSKTTSTTTRPTRIKLFCFLNFLINSIVF